MNWAKIRNSNYKSGEEVVYRKSLQTCTLSNNMTVIENHIKSIKSPQILGHLKAMRAILKMLLAVLPGDDGIMRRKTINGTERLKKVDTRTTFEKKEIWVRAYACNG